MIHSVSVIRLSVRVMYDSLRRQPLINTLTRIRPTTRP